MVKFIVKRLAMMAATLFVILLMTFLIMHAIPGGPYSAGKRLPEAIQAALDEKYNLNAPPLCPVLGLPPGGAAL